MGAIADLLRKAARARPHAGTARAVWNGAVLAESDETIVLEGNHYFPVEGINREYFRESSHHSFCPWKGTASYYTIEVDGRRSEAAAWFYREPKPAAGQIEGRVAFWHGVQVVPG